MLRRKEEEEENDRDNVLTYCSYNPGFNFIMTPIYR